MRFLGDESQVETWSWSMFYGHCTRHFPCYRQSIHINNIREESCNLTRGSGETAMAAEKAWLQGQNLSITLRGCVLISADQKQIKESAGDPICFPQSPLLFSLGCSPWEVLSTFRQVLASVFGNTYHHSWPHNTSTMCLMNAPGGTKSNQVGDGDKL